MNLLRSFKTEAHFKTFGQTLSDSHMAALTAILG